MEWSVNNTFKSLKGTSLNIEFFFVQMLFNVWFAIVEIVSFFMTLYWF